MSDRINVKNWTFEYNLKLIIMETVLELKNKTIVRNSGSSIKKSKYDLWIESLNFSYFGIITMTILVGSIIGGIAAAVILSNNAPIWQLGLCAAVSMGNNAGAIAQAPTKWIVNLFFISLIANAALILMNVI